MLSRKDRLVTLIAVALVSLVASSAAAQDEVLLKLQGRMDRLAGPQPTPDDIREATGLRA